MYVIIVVPCYNEMERLPANSFFEFIERNENISFLFVNDGSTDNTGYLLKEMHIRYPESIMVLDLAKNQGKAEAVREGFKFCFSLKPKIIGFWDADLATPLTAINEFLKIYDEFPEIDWVFGSRVKLLGRKIDRKEIRHYFGRFFATITSIILDLPVYDTQCGAKLFKFNKLLENIFSERFISRWIFDVELIARLQSLSSNNNLPKRIIYEYPLREWSDISGSKLKLSDFFIAVYDLYNIRRYLHISR
jgi:glycosyltransferase involved in cell wall biosynthesis